MYFRHFVTIILIFFAASSIFVILWACAAYYTIKKAFRKWFDRKIDDSSFNSKLKWMWVYVHRFAVCTLCLRVYVQTLKFINVYKNSPKKFLFLALKITKNKRTISVYIEPKIMFGGYKCKRNSSSCDDCGAQIKPCLFDSDSYSHTHTYTHIGECKLNSTFSVRAHERNGSLRANVFVCAFNVHVLYVRWGESMNFLLKRCCYLSLLTADVR